MHTLLKHKEFIQGMSLGNCPNPDNQTLLEVVEAAKEVNIQETWVCTCEATFNKWVKELVSYCQDNIWNETFLDKVNKETLSKVKKDLEKLNTKNDK